MYFLNYIIHIYYNNYLLVLQLTFSVILLNIYYIYSFMCVDMSAKGRFAGIIHNVTFTV